MLQEITGHPIQVQNQGWRTGDQPVYVSDISKASQHFGWEPRVNYRDGILKLVRWISDNQDLFSDDDEA